MMVRQSEASGPPDRWEIDLWPDNTMAEKCAKITKVIRDGYELREVVFYDRGGKVHAKCNLIRSIP
jgi:hypothetical protein